MNYRTWHLLVRWGFVVLMPVLLAGFLMPAGGLGPLLVTVGVALVMVLGSLLARLNRPAQLLMGALAVCVAGCSSVSVKDLDSARYWDSGMRLPSVEHVDSASLTGTITSVSPFGRIEAASRYRRFEASRDSATRHWSGMDGGTPEFVLEEIRMSINGTVVPIPAASYAWCGESFLQSSNLSLHHFGRKIGLCYEGGDGAGAHAIMYVIDAGRVDRVFLHGWNGVSPEGYPQKGWLEKTALKAD